MRLVMMPGPSASVMIRNSAARPSISMRRFGQTSLPMRARGAGSTRSVTISRAASRACCTQSWALMLNNC
jgi:hypothetical protein